MLFTHSIFISLKHNKLQSSYFLPNDDCIFNPDCNLKVYDSYLCDIQLLHLYVHVPSLIIMSYQDYTNTINA